MGLSVIVPPLAERTASYSTKKSILIYDLGSWVVQLSQLVRSGSGKALRREYLHPPLLRTSELLDLSAYGFAREPCPKLPGADRYD